MKGPFNRNVIFMQCLDKITFLRLSSWINSKAASETQSVVKPLTLLQTQIGLRSASLSLSALSPQSWTQDFTEWLNCSFWSFACLLVKTGEIEQFAIFGMRGRRLGWQRGVCAGDTGAGLSSFPAQELLLTGTFLDFGTHFEAHPLQWSYSY